MLARLREEEDGFGLIELSMAMVILTIALLVLSASYDSAAVSLQKSGQETTASSLADAQLELYGSLPFASIGLDEATLQGVQNAGPNYDSLYVSDEATLNAALEDPTDATDVPIPGCGSSPQCLPVQTVTGADHRSYQLETFIRDVANQTSISWTVRVVTVIVRDPSTSGSPILDETTTAFDRGP